MCLGFLFGFPHCEFVLSQVATLILYVTLSSGPVCGNTPDEEGELAIPSAEVMLLCVYSLQQRTTRPKKAWQEREDKTGTGKKWREERKLHRIRNLWDMEMTKEGHSSPGSGPLSLRDRKWEGNRTHELRWRKWGKLGEKIQGNTQGRRGGRREDYMCTISRCFSLYCFLNSLYYTMYHNCKVYTRKFIMLWDLDH